MKKSVLGTELVARFVMISSLFLISAAQADPPLSFMGVAVTDSYQSMHKKLFYSAESSGYSGQRNNNDFARWAAFTDLTIFGVSASHAVLFTDRSGDRTLRSLRIWLNSAVDFDSHVDEISKTLGKPDEVTEDFGNQASPVAVWSKSADGISYELVFEGGIAMEEVAALFLSARYANEEIQQLSE